MTVRRFTGAAAAVTVAALLLTEVVPTPLRAQQTLLGTLNASSPLKVFPVRERIFAVIDPAGGPNTTLQIGDDGVVVVDPGRTANGKAILDIVAALTRLPIRFVINTTADPEHVGANAVVAAAGRGFEGVAGQNEAPRASGIAHENVLRRMTGLGEQAALPSAGWPTLPFFGRKKEVHFNDEVVQVLHQPAAHGDGDSVVFFRGSDVVSAGPIFLTTTYPVIDTARGGSIDGVIRALNAVIDLTTTKKNQEGGTLVVPAHGRISDEADVVEYRDMLAIIRGRVQHFVKQGMTLEQIRRERPTLDYDGRYGTGAGAAAPAAFLDIVYQGAVAAAKGGQP
jgi:glyoxylase-like metal-dependent hydrolase (beta-lactamase superfamily II)